MIGSKFGRTGAAFLSACAITLAVGSGLAQARPPQRLEIRFIAVSDWHGQVEPLSIFGEGTFGGAAALSTYFQMERLDNPNTLTLTAGDAFGASLPLSSFFDEVPAVMSMNLMGFDVDTFGNHNFDRGIAHLQQMIDIAEFKYVSANLRNRHDNLTGVKDFKIFDLGGVKVGVIGITNPEAPTLVFPGSFGTIEVTDPVRAAKRAKARARRAGAKVFVAITHLGVDRRNGRIIDRSVEFVDPVSDAVIPDPEIVAFLNPLRAELSTLLGAVIGESTVFIPRADECGRADGRTCESLVGDVATDALRVTYGTDFAITNSGGLRADLTCPTADSATDFCPPHTGPNFQITDGQVLTVLPFGNVAATLTVDGALLKQYLENGVSAMPAANGRFPQISGLCFTYDIDAPAGSRVIGAVRQAADGSFTGAAIDLASALSYTLATNDFMAAGGDGYPVVTDRIVTRNFMDQDVAAYVAENTPISPVIQGRITCIGSTCPTPLP